MKRIIGLIIIISVLATLCFGQEKIDSTTSATLLRAEATLSALPDQFSQVDEPVLRVFLRLKLARYLWAKEEKAGNEKAALLATDAAADLQAHKAAIPKMLAEGFEREMKASLRMYAPALTAQLQESGLLKQDTDRNGESNEAALAQLDAKRIDEAEKTLRRSLHSGRPPDLDLIWVLGDVARGYPERLPPLLTEILNAVELNANQVSLENLFWFQRFYLGIAIIEGEPMKDNIPSPLKLRWFHFIEQKIISVHTTQAWGKQARAETAYLMLGEITAESMKLDQALYLRINSLKASVGGLLLPQVRDQLDGEIRSSQNADRAGETLGKADTSKTKTQKEEFILIAADQALKKGDLPKALELIRETKGEEKSILVFRDQICADLTARSLEKGEPDQAVQAAAEINGLRERIQAKRKIALYYLKTGNLPEARAILNNAVQQVESSEDEITRIRCFLGLAETYSRTDPVRVFEMIQSSVKAINYLRSPKYESSLTLNSTEKVKYDEDLRRLFWTALDIIPAFQEWAKADEFGARSLAQNIRNRGIREAAVFGICLGLLELHKNEKKPIRTTVNKS